VESDWPGQKVQFGRGTDLAESPELLWLGPSAEEVGLAGIGLAELRGWGSGGITARWGWAGGQDTKLTQFSKLLSGEPSVGAMA
jgi:hypothetical protein